MVEQSDRALNPQPEAVYQDRAHAERLASCGASLIKAVGDLCGAIEDQADGGIQFPPTALQASHRVTASMQAMGQAIRDFRNASVVAMHPVAFAYRYPDGRNCTLGWNEPGEGERMALFVERRPVLKTPLYELVGSCVGPSSHRDEVFGPET